MTNAKFFEKYLIKKGKIDLLSSLKGLDKKIINKEMRYYDLDSLAELKEYIIDSFELCLSMSKDDMFTKLYFQRLLENENSNVLSAYRDDIKALWAFVYEKDSFISYYIPTEIKNIIKKELNL